MRGVPALLGLVPEERREVDDPEDLVAVGGDKIEAGGELHPQRAQRLAGGGGSVGDDQQQVARLRGLETLVDAGDLLAV